MVVLDLCSAYYTTLLGVDAVVTPRLYRPSCTRSSRSHAHPPPHRPLYL